MSLIRIIILMILASAAVSAAEPVVDSTVQPDAREAAQDALKRHQAAEELHKIHRNKAPTETDDVKIKEQ